MQLLFDRLRCKCTGGSCSSVGGKRAEGWEGREVVVRQLHFAAVRHSETLSRWSCIVLRLQATDAL